MGNLKTNLIILAVLTTLLWGSGLTSSYGSEPKLAEVIYITKSKACGCAVKTVQAAVPYIGEYHLIQLPALIFLDGQKHLLWMAVGEVGKEDVGAKLSQFGG